MGMGWTPWVKMHPSRATNKKLRKAGFAARGLDEACILQSADDGTDGHVDEDMVGYIAAAHGEKKWKPLVELLVKVGRWEAVDGGWLIHDYEEFNQTDAYWKAYSEKKSNAGKVGGKASGRARAKPPDPPSGEASAQAPASPDGQAADQSDAQAASSRYETKPPPTPEGWVGGGTTSTSDATHAIPPLPAAAAEWPTADDNHVPDVLDAVTELVALERLKRAQAGPRGVSNPTGWLRSVSPSIRAELRDQVERIVHRPPPPGGWRPKVITDVVMGRSQLAPIERPPCPNADCHNGNVFVDEDQPELGMLPCPDCKPALVAKAG